MTDTKKQKRARYVAPKGIAVFPWRGMTTAEFYTRRAEEFLQRGERIPIDLFYQLLAVGIDVDALERRTTKEYA